MSQDINRIKVVLTEQKRTVKWLGQQLKMSPSTVSKWCTNTAQPKLETLWAIAEVLDVDVRLLLNSSKSDSEYLYVRADKVAEPREKYGSIS